MAQGTTSVEIGNAGAAIGLARLLKERGDEKDARALLDAAERAGWRYARDLDPTLATRPKDAPLDLGTQWWSQ